MVGMPHDTLTTGETTKSTMGNTSTEENLAETTWMDTTTQICESGSDCGAAGNYPCLAYGLESPNVRILIGEGKRDS